MNFRCIFHHFSLCFVENISKYQAPLSQDIVIPGSLDLIEVIAALEKSKPLRERRFLTAFFGRADLVPSGPCWDQRAPVGRCWDLGKFWEIPTIRGFLLGNLLRNDRDFIRFSWDNYGDFVTRWTATQKNPRHHLGLHEALKEPWRSWSHRLRCEVLIRGLEVWMFERNSSP